MAASDPQTAARVARLGMGLISPASGLAALEGALASSAPAPVISAVPFKWSRMAQRLGPDVPHFFSGVITASPSPPSRPPPGATAGARPRAAGQAAPAAAAEVGLQVQETVASILGHSVSPDEPLMAAGLDSLGAVELRNALEGRLGGQGLTLPPTLVFDYPTTAALSAFIISQRLASDSSVSEAAADNDIQCLPASFSPRAQPAGGVTLSVTALSHRCDSCRFAACLYQSTLCAPHPKQTTHLNAY
jgi:acyl carrier protein